VNSASTLTPVHPVRGVRLTALLEQVGYDPTDAAATDVIVGAMDGYATPLPAG